jgi:hypothetical protein
MLYICIHTDKKIEFAEEYPTETQEQIDWANKNKERLEMECILRRPEVWEPYSSDEKQFEFEVKKK